MAKLNLPADKDLVKTLVENDAVHTNKRLERGIIGSLLGDAQEKPGNVAGVVATLSLLAIISVIAFGREGQSFSQKEQVLLLLSVLTSSMSFLFGEKSGSKRR